VRIGVLRDTSFQFYYPENLDELRRQGAELVEINALKEKKLPEVSALYIGGGFPETMAEALASNVSFRQSVFSAVESGMPVWAECGGAMFLGRSVEFEGKRYPMVGVFPVEFGFSRKPQWHGYTELEVDKPNPFFNIGTTIRAHEFHYSFVEESSGIDTIFRVKRGYGIDGARDGMIYKNTIALYSHLYDLYSCTGWAKAFVDSACVFEKAKASTSNFEVGRKTVRESIIRAV
jgi:cobyrinic acid a,c-diamide synthase